MMVPKAILVLSGVLCDHVPALPLQQKGEETAHDSQTSGHLESSTLPIPDPPFFFFFKQKDMFLPLLFIWTVCWGKGHPSDLSTYRRFITGGGGRAKVEQDTIFPSLLCFWNGRTKSVAPQFCPKSRNKAIMEAANEKSSL